MRHILVEILGTTVAASMLLWLFWAWIGWDAAVYGSWAYMVIGGIGVFLLED